MVDTKTSTLLLFCVSCNALTVQHPSPKKLGHDHRMKRLNYNHKSFTGRATDEHRQGIVHAQQSQDEMDQVYQKAQHRLEEAQHARQTFDSLVEKNATVENLKDFLHSELDQQTVLTGQEISSLSKAGEDSKLAVLELTDSFAQKPKQAPEEPSMEAIGKHYLVSQVLNDPNDTASMSLFQQAFEEGKLSVPDIVAELRKYPALQKRAMKEVLPYLPALGAATSTLPNVLPAVYVFGKIKAALGHLVPGKPYSTISKQLPLQGNEHKLQDLQLKAEAKACFPSEIQRMSWKLTLCKDYFDSCKLLDTCQTIQNFALNYDKPCPYNCTTLNDCAASQVIGSMKSDPGCEKKWFETGLHLATSCSVDQYDTVTCIFGTECSNSHVSKSESTVSEDGSVCGTCVDVNKGKESPFMSFVYGPVKRTCDADITKSTLTAWQDTKWEKVTSS